MDRYVLEVQAESGEGHSRQQDCKCKGPVVGKSGLLEEPAGGQVAGQGGGRQATQCLPATVRGSDFEDGVEPLTGSSCSDRAGVAAWLQCGEWCEGLKPGGRSGSERPQPACMVRSALLSRGSVAALELALQPSLPSSPPGTEGSLEFPEQAYSPRVCVCTCCSSTVNTLP